MANTEITEDMDVDDGDGGGSDGDDEEDEEDNECMDDGSAVNTQKMKGV